MASGAHAKAAMKVAVTATFKTAGLFVELNMKQCGPLGAPVNVWGETTMWFSALSDYVLLSFLDQICELIKEVRCIMGTGRSFGMILYAEYRQFLVPHSLNGAVV